MFPNVDTNDGDVGLRLVSNCKEDDTCALTEKRILICGGDNLEDLRCGIVPEPAPAASLNPNSSSVELFLKPLNRAKVAHNRVLKLSILEFPTAFLHRSEVLPKECVVDVACYDDEQRANRKVTGWLGLPPPLNLSAACNAI